MSNQGTGEGKIAVVTGGNRGIGFEVCRQLAKAGVKVVLTSRDTRRGEDAAAKLSSEGLAVIPHVLEVSNPDSVRALRSFIERGFGRLDILVNNAGIFKDPSGISAFTGDAGIVRETFETNTIGPFLLCQALIPLMRGNGRVVNVSSGLGQLSDMGGSYPGYRLSKVALNALTRIFADELQGTKIKVNSVCPGWVRTDMGGADAARSVETGADTIVWAALLPDDGPTGGFFRDRKPIAW